MAGVRKIFQCFGSALITVARIEGNVAKTLSDFSGGGCLMGEMQEKSDAQLLREYAEGGDERAFRDLVARQRCCPMGSIAGSSRRQR